MSRLLTAHDRLRLQLTSHGFAFFTSNDLPLSENLAASREAFVAAAKQLPADPYCALKNRNRAFHRALYMPWRRGSQRLVFLPPHTDPVTGEQFTVYEQGLSNPEHAHLQRRFAPMPEIMRSNRALLEVIERDLALTPFAGAMLEPYSITLHVIRHTVRPGEVAVATPNLLHQDDVLMSFVHIIEREGVFGGVNVIAEPHHAGKPIEAISVKETLAVATVAGDWSGYAFVDSKVSHYVSAITTAPEVELGARTILTVDIAPLQSQLIL